MFQSSKKVPGDISAATVLAKGIRVDAALMSGKGAVKIEGEYFGEINIDGELVLEESGRINGNINVNVAYISGIVIGNIKCADILHIKSTGKVKGDIECETILMDAGAIFTGYSKMKDIKLEEIAPPNFLSLNPGDNKNNPDPLGLDE